MRKGESPLASNEAPGNALPQAAAALERIASPLHRLRVLLHLELAHCYIAEDVLVTADKQVQRQRWKSRES